MLNKEKIKLIIFIFLLLIISLNFSKIIALYGNAEDIIQSSGVYGPIIYSLLMILVIIISPIPSSPLVIMAGMVFNPWLAIIYTLISATIGAILAFFIGRFFFKDILRKSFIKNDLYKKIQENPKKITSIIFLTRLMPQISFDLISYLAGLTSIKLRSFIIATFFGMIPMIFILIFFGHYIINYKNIILLVLFIIFIVYTIYLIYLNNKK